MIHRFAIRAPNRAEAVRQLLKIGQACTIILTSNPTKPVHTDPRRWHAKTESEINATGRKSAARKPTGGNGPKRCQLKHDYSVGDIVFWATASAAGEYTVIGHPKGQPDVLVFAAGREADAEDCQPTGRRDPEGAL